MRSLDALLDRLASVRDTEPNAYLAVPHELRQLAEARSAAQTGAEVDSRNRVARNFDALGSAGSTFLSRPDASREELQLILRQQAAQRQAADQKAMAERLDVFGTPYAYEARNREASGGIYRDDASVNRMLHLDPAGLAAELQGQGPAEPPAPDEGMQGGFGVISGGDPRMERQQLRRDDLLGLAEGAAARKAKPAKVTPGEKARDYFHAERKVTQRASEEGVAAVVDAIQEKASRDAHFALLAGKLIHSLRSRRLKGKALDDAELGQGSPLVGPEGGLTDERLPADRAQLLRLRALLGAQ